LSNRENKVPEKLQDLEKKILAKTDTAIDGLRQFQMVRKLSPVFCNYNTSLDPKEAQRID